MDVSGYHSSGLLPPKAPLCASEPLSDHYTVGCSSIVKQMMMVMKMAIMTMMMVMVMMAMKKQRL